MKKRVVDRSTAKCSARRGTRGTPSCLRVISSATRLFRKCQGLDSKSTAAILLRTPKLFPKSNPTRLYPDISWASALLSCRMSSSIPRGLRVSATCPNLRHDFQKYPESSATPNPTRHCECTYPLRTKARGISGNVPDETAWNRAAAISSYRLLCSSSTSNRPLTQFSTMISTNPEGKYMTHSSMKCFSVLKNPENEYILIIKKPP